MNTPPLLDASLLAPVTPEMPAGDDMASSADWQAIKEARRSDDAGSQGGWEHERKDSNWHAVFDLTSAALSIKSKDLRLAVWLTEASLHLHQFPGLRDSFALIRGLMEAFWDIGLHPRIEDGDLNFRAVPLEWLGEKLAQAARQIPLTARIDADRDYSLADYYAARAVGFERDLVDANGNENESRRHRRQISIAQGGMTGEKFEAAVKATRRSSVEKLALDIEAAIAEFSALDRCLDEKFGREAPSVAEARDVLHECQDLIATVLRGKRLEEPDPAAKPQAPETSSASTLSLDGELRIGPPARHVAVSSDDPWFSAETLIREGNLKQGLAEMTRLAAAEHGRSRFLRKLALAQTCKAIKRDRLAVAILEELAGQIDAMHLEQWESPDLIATVWGTLYRYRRAAEPGSAHADQAVTLLDKLCRLDPWQALHWEE